MLLFGFSSALFLFVLFYERRGGETIHQPCSASFQQRDELRSIGAHSAFLQLVRRLGAVAALCKRARPGEGQARGTGKLQGLDERSIFLPSSPNLPFQREQSFGEHLHFGVGFGVNTFLLTYPGLPSFHVMCGVGRSSAYVRREPLQLIRSALQEWRQW